MMIFALNVEFSWRLRKNNTLTEEKEIEKGFLLEKRKGIQQTRLKR